MEGRTAVERVLDSSVEPRRATKEGVILACGSDGNTPASAGRSFVRAERSMADEEQWRRRRRRKMKRTMTNPKCTQMQKRIDKWTIDEVEEFLRATFCSGRPSEEVGGLGNISMIIQQQVPLTTCKSSVIHLLFPLNFYHLQYKQFIFFYIFSSECTHGCCSYPLCVSDHHDCMRPRAVSLGDSLLCRHGIFSSLDSNVMEPWRHAHGLSWQ